MLQILVITLREGIEAFLIVAITLAYLRKSGRVHLLPAVYWGTGAAVLLSVGASFLLNQASNKPLWEGLLAAAAAVMVSSMTIYMWSTARRMKAKIGAQLESAVTRDGPAAFWGVLAFVLFMITREGMETALIVSALMFQVGSADMLAGALIGTLSAALLAWAWGRYGHRVNLSRFLQVTAVFLLLFSVQLVIYAFHEFTEASLLPIDNAYWHLASEPYGPEGRYGHLLTYGLVAIPVLWLAIATLKEKVAAPKHAG